MIETLLTKLETLSELRSHVHKQAKDNYLCFPLTHFHHFKTAHTDYQGEPGYSFQWAQGMLPRLTAPPCLCEEDRVWPCERRSKAKSRGRPLVREAGTHTVKRKEKKDPILTSCTSTYTPTPHLEDQTVCSSLCAEKPNTSFLLKLRVPALSLTLKQTSMSFSLGPRNSICPCYSSPIFN